jgi:hypothetical protein
MPRSPRRRTVKCRPYKSKSKKRTRTPPNTRRSTPQQRQRVKTQQRKSRHRRIYNDRVRARNMELKRIAQRILNLIWHGGLRELDMDLIDRIDDENIMLILYDVIQNSDGEMDDEEEEVVMDWINVKLNYPPRP